MDFKLMMDNDSGYMSHNQESNLDSSNEVNFAPTPSRPIYFSEDALLEKPPPSDNIDSVINNSVESVKTNFSGFDDSENEQEDTLNTSFLEMQPALTTHQEDEGRPETPKRYSNPQNSSFSPDLFEDEEEEAEKSGSELNSSFNANKSLVIENSAELKLLRNVQSGMSGVCPPPSVTIVQMSVDEMLSKIKQNKKYFWDQPVAADEPSTSCTSHLISNSAESVHSTWPEILQFRFHGLHYNRTKVNEQFEHLCNKYAERYVGAETSSTCTVFETKCSPLKRKFSKPRWEVKSPGRRLSHLARRRITFSSSNLQSSSSSSILGSRARQILVDAKKMNSAPPKRSPAKSPFRIKKSTPSSSAKKKLAMRFRQMSGELENIAPGSSKSIPSVKRTLFASPKDKQSSPPFPAERKSTKRALFSSPQKRQSPKKLSPFKYNLGDRKRKRCDDNSENPNSKMAKTCDNKSNRAADELSESHKKKLQWAVYEALRLQNIPTTHPQYKVFASILARVTRKFLPSANFEARTTEKMFRIARYHSYAVIKGKTMDAIVSDYMKSKAKLAKPPQGYIGLEDLHNLRNKEGSSRENVLQDRANILASIERRRELTGGKGPIVDESRIDRIRKVISFDDRR